MIPYGRQEVLEEDIDAVIDVLRSGLLTQGPTVPSFEKTIAEYSGAAHAVAVNSATSALHIACLALGLGPGDLLWTSPITFVASANCARYCGAEIDFVDIDLSSYNISIDALKRKLLAAEQHGRLPKIVVPVHLCGLSCDMEELSALSKRYGFKVLEDASHAIGGSYRKSRIGSCAFSDVTVFSFHPVKIITSIEGGMALTNDQELADRMAVLRTHGITRDRSKMTTPVDELWYYEQIELGFNYRMSDVQAALGISQSKRINNYVKKRNQLAHRYDKLLVSLPFETPPRTPDCYSAFHLYVIRLIPGKGPMMNKRNQLFNRLREAGVGVNLHYIPVHLQPYYRCLGFGPGDFPEAERYFQEALTLPLFPTMERKEQDFIVANLEKAALQ